MRMREQAYRALQHAAEQIGQNNYRNGLYRRRKVGRKWEGYTITEEHRQLIDAMPAVLEGRITPEEAMALLHQHDVEKQRFATR